MNFMKESEGAARQAGSTDLHFPDWSGMDDSSARITPEAAFRLCEPYPQLLADFCRGDAETRVKVASGICALKPADLAQPLGK